VQKRYDMILSAEGSFARTVALGVVVRRPLTAWHYLIPGMFLIDFLRRSAEIRKYSEHFLFPRRQALDAARRIWNGEDSETAILRASEAIEAWLNSVGLYSEELQRSQMEAVQLLIDHYGTLMSAQGDSYYSLIENAYHDRRDCEAYVSRIAAAEQEVDRAILERLGETELLREKLHAEQREVARMREKEADIAFST
jgi:hypothetical protein